MCVCNLSAKTAYSVVESKPIRSYQVPTDEKRWLRQARDGDELAFGHIVEAYERPVYNLCYRMLGDQTLAEDAAQETFLKAFLGLKRYDPKRVFVNWLLSIASHHCIDRLRRRRLKLVPLESEKGVIDVVDTVPGPEGVLARAEQEQEIRQSLLQLANKDRAAIVLFYWHGLSYVEIAETLSLTPGAVKSRLHRARRTLAEHWLDLQDENLAIQGIRDEAPTF
jgi:RNA polymerase sigma-70 factor (ECF subfamily)